MAKKNATRSTQTGGEKTSQKAANPTARPNRGEAKRGEPADSPESVIARVTGFGREQSKQVAERLGMSVGEMIEAHKSGKLRDAIGAS